MRIPIQNSTILVTGGAGFIGGHLVDRLLEEQPKQVIVVDNLFVGEKANLSDALKKGVLLYVDDAEIEGCLDSVFSRHSIDIVFNCATKALNYSFLNPSNAFMTNVVVIKNLLELQRKKAFQTLCHFSSSEAYGSSVYEPMDENHPLQPTTTYAAGKAAADLMLQSYVRMFDLDAFIVRAFNNYGPRQSNHRELAAVIPKTIEKILSGEAPEIHGTGQQKRDFIYVGDTVEAVINVFSKLKPGEVVNISADSQVAIGELVEKIAQLLRYNGDIVQREARKADVISHNGCNQKLKTLVRDLRFTPLEQGLKETIRWYKGGK
ncbi:dTDP-glucose 4,6-dehydratase [Melghirimyces algeriensis]|uniref:UDP-glucose 4-epimerase n=1 Tax=Melghirimyces algeriensis TaxID=910412 RepID=A0A521CAV3_9BACL|nr:NAD-dependent epimerase/dehydratase family protein [Melghirimyces algeriensis]SMO56495.1 UDP-glucose 4-epimerase [Melghirimyces algeriensis]